MKLEEFELVPICVDPLAQDLALCGEGNYKPVRVVLKNCAWVPKDVGAKLQLLDLEADLYVKVEKK